MFTNHHESHAEDIDIEDDVDLLERFIPVTVEDLLDDLAQSEKLNIDERALFAKVCEMFVAIYHANYHKYILKLKRAYNLFSPDCDTVQPKSVPESEKDKYLEMLKREVPDLLNSEILMVGDSIKRDLAPAKLQGLKTAIAKYGQLGKDKGKADYELWSFEDLIKVIE